ncbi:MAG: hypothetical protein IKO61_01560 [Lachnospiraceae bacterium]|nr:hypothetical protein [Lachnospiraceae bacterium]
MKGIVEHYAKGEFWVDRPEVSISVERLHLLIEAGTVYSGSFIVESMNNLLIKAMVYDSRYMLKFEEHSYINKKFAVKYSFDATCLEAGKNYRGHISVITDGGEFKIPYDIEITPPCVKYGDQKIDDLFKFATLAESNWGEAARVFVRDDFKRTFVDRDPVVKQIYTSLLESQSVDQAMEEFLVYVHKKRALTLSVSKAKISIDVPSEMTKVSVNISKNTWGYTYSRVKTSDDFIMLARKVIKSSDFCGNLFSLDVMINPENIPEGTGSGKITIENVYQQIEVEIILNRPRTKNIMPARVGNRLQLVRSNQTKLITAYLDYRMDRLSLNDYVNTSLNVFKNLARYMPEEALYRMGILHMNIMQGETARVEQEFVRIEADVDNSVMSNIERSYYTYLKAMVEKTRDSIEKARNLIRRNFRIEKEKIFYFWLLLFIDDTYSQDLGALYREIQTLYEQGYNSPIMYLELCEVLNNNPLLFKRISNLEITTIRWGLRHRYISDEVVEEFVKMAGSVKNFDTQIFSIMEAIYEKKGNVDVLKSICSMLISSGRLDNKYHKFYRDAVDKGLKFIGLNECFVKSMNFSRYDVIPQSVLYYLNYKNTLSEQELAYLYANVIFNKSQHMKVYHEYCTTMQDFMENMIIKGKVSDDLTVIYDEFLEPESVNSKYADKLINIIFRRKLVCFNKSVRAVIVTHREIEEVQRVPIVDGEAYIEVLSNDASDASIIFEDADGNRYAGSIPYHLERIVDEKAYLDICRRYSPNDYRVLLYNYKQLGDFTFKDAKEVNSAREIVQCEEISYDYKQQAYLNIIEYYHQNLDNDVLTKYLGKLDIEYLNHANARTLIGYMIDMNMFDKAFAAVKLYGFDEVDSDELYRLADYGVEDSSGFLNEDLLAICVHLYKMGKVNERILSYVMTHFQGDLDELASLFKVVRNRVKDVSFLAENTLAQMMFSMGSVEYIYDIFTAYYGGRSRGLVVKAFLRYAAFNSLIRDVQTPGSIFDCLYLEILKGNIDDEISKMALLSYFSKLDRYTGDEKEWISDAVMKFMDAGKLMPFFKSFKSFIRLPLDVFLKTYLIYKSDPGKVVTVKYAFDTGSRQTLSYKRERLDEMIPGLYVKEFVVFHGERLVYSVDDDMLGTSYVVESESLKTKAFNKEDKDRFETINAMLVNQEMREDNELLETLDVYLNTVHLFEENLVIL